TQNTAKILEINGIKTNLIPNKKSDLTTRIIIEEKDCGKARSVLNKLGIPINQKEVVFLSLEDKPGVLANITKKIASNGINLNYAFSVPFSPGVFYAVFATSDNNKTLALLSEHEKP
ncbi:hypothetical protein HZC07_03945, partial [Candidatus Micrarchaeota archaeon]|nr:hypothetical protein [Candidatus Micrarchaeota archaeon]